MSEKIKIDRLYNDLSANRGREPPTSNDSINANKQLNNHYDAYIPNNFAGNGNNNVSNPHLSLSQITESLDETNSSTSHSQLNSTNQQPQQFQHSRNKTSSCSNSNYHNNPQIDDIENEIKFSYIKAIAQAIIETPNHEILLNNLYTKIITKYPELKNKRVDWQNGIRHNLSLNECFVKLDRNTSGKGHYWGIRHSNLDHFLRGDFRRRWNQSRTRCKRPKYNQQNEYNLRKSDRLRQGYNRGNYNENDAFDLSYHGNYYFPYPTNFQNPFPIQYHSSLNNAYSMDHLNREYDQMCAQLYANQATPLDTHTPMWHVPPRSLCYPRPYFQGIHNPYIVPQQSFCCDHYLNDSIPYLVDESDPMDEVNTVLGTNTQRSRETNFMAINDQDKRTNHHTLPSPSINYSPHTNSCKPIIRSYFKNTDACNLKNQDRSHTNLDMEGDLFEPDMENPKFDVNSLLNR